MSNNFMNCSFEELEKVLFEIVNNQSNLENSYKILSNYVGYRNFFFNLLKICFSSQEEKVKKFASSSLKILLSRNYQSIPEEEKKIIFSSLLESIQLYYNKDYFTKNLIAFLIGLFISKEIHNHSYASSIQILTSNLLNPQNTNDMNQMILRIFSNILNQTDDSIGKFAHHIIFAMLQIIPSTNPKNKEKALLIIIAMLNKISYADGTDEEFINQSLKKDGLANRLFELLDAIIEVKLNAKQLYDIKKYAVRIYHIFSSDFPYFCQSNDFSTLILSKMVKILRDSCDAYFMAEIIHRELPQSPEEIATVASEGYNFVRGYESDSDEENEGISGFVYEVIKALNEILISESQAPEDCNEFLLVVKLYTIMQKKSFENYHAHEVEFIEEEFEFENDDFEEDGSYYLVRKQGASLLLELLMKFESKVALNLIKLLISELSNGIDGSIYKSILTSKEAFSDPSVVELINESNLFLLSELSDVIGNFYESEQIEKNDIEHIVNSLLGLISNEKLYSSILLPRIMLSLVKFKVFFVDAHQDTVNLILRKIIEATVAEKNTSKLCKLVGACCIFQISEGKIQDQNLIKKAYDCLIRLLEKENIKYIVQGISGLANSNKDCVEYLMSNYFKEVLLGKVFILSESYNDTILMTYLSKMIQTISTNGRENASNEMIWAIAPIIFCISKANLQTKHSNLMTQFLAQSKIKNTEELFISSLRFVKIVLKEAAKEKFTVEGSVGTLNDLATVVAELAERSTNADMSLIQLMTLYFKYYIQVEKSNPETAERYINFLVSSDKILESSLRSLGKVCWLVFERKQQLNKEFLNKMIEKVFRLQIPSIIESFSFFFLNLMLSRKEEFIAYLKSNDTFHLLKQKIETNKGTFTKKRVLELIEVVEKSEII